MNAENTTAGGTGQDAQEDSINLVAPREAGELSKAGEIDLIDVRTEHEWDAGRIPGARHVPLETLKDRASEIVGGKPIVIYCRAGNRSKFAAEGLRDAGIQARALEGGALAWEEADLPIEPEAGYVTDSGEAQAILNERERSGERPPGIPY